MQISSTSCRAISKALRIKAFKLCPFGVAVSFQSKMVGLPLSAIGDQHSGYDLTAVLLRLCRRG